MTAIDWDAEIRKIEREFDGLPPEPSTAALRAKRTAEVRAREQADRRMAKLGTVARLALVALLVAGLAFWPYASRCGVSLAAMLGAQLMVVVGGAWSTVHTWRHRFAAAHAIALGFTAAGLVLLSLQVLPRQGYATFRGIEVAGWSCAAGVR